MPKRRFAVLVIWLALSVASLFAQNTNTFNEQTKLIRIKKIATEWQGSMLTLHTRDGREMSGRLIEVSGGNYHLGLVSGSMEIPLGEVVKVSFKPGLPELMLTIASAAMGTAFMSATILIANDEATQGDVSLAALIGLLGGGLWGYTTFYETEVIELE